MTQDIFMPAPEERTPFFGIKALFGLFFLSGFSALCYQIVWQRILFATFGINIESVTIIVSLFMFGLGIGALFGGWAQRFPGALLGLFVGFELCVGLFGIGSPFLIAWLGGFPDLQSLWVITFCVFILFVVPTFFMGATLPVLTGHIDRFIGHTRKSVCWLYASNTAGAVLASVMTVTVLFVYFGLHAVILIAAALNFCTALAGFLLYRRAGGNRIPAPHEEETRPDFQKDATRPGGGMLLFMGAAIGFIALSQELIWFRFLGYVSANRPQIFGLMLGAVLAGIALAAIQAENMMAQKNHLLPPWRATF